MIVPRWIACACALCFHATKRPTPSIELLGGASLACTKKTLAHFHNDCPCFIREINTLHLLEEASIHPFIHSLLARINHHHWVSHEKILEQTQFRSILSMFKLKNYEILIIDNSKSLNCKEFETLQRGPTGAQVPSESPQYGDRERQRCKHTRP